MGKILGSWSGMRKYLEQEMLAEALKGQVRYNCTAYKGMDGCHIFEFFINNKPIKRFSWETVNSYFIENGYTDNPKPYGVSEYWQGFWALLEKYPVNSRTEYTDEEFCDALKMYRNQDIGNSIQSENPIVKMFALLDRRVGKRTLIKIKDEIDTQPEWLQELYKLRVTAELQDKIK